MPSFKPLSVVIAALFLAPAAGMAAEPVQKVKPPVSQVWIDLATFSGGMPAMGGPGAMLGSLFGGAANTGNVFGNTQSGTMGRWMDVTLLTRRNADLRTGAQATPEPGKFQSPLKLVAPVEGKPEPVPAEDSTPAPQNYEMPKGKLILYWGCSAEVRKGQPLVLDLSKMDRTQYAKFFQTRSATTQPPRPAPGRPVWPNKTDDRMIPDGASLVGDHAFSGEGVPEGFAFKLDAHHDLMPAIALSRREEGNAVLFSWQAMPQARAWFIASMGTRAPESDKGEMEMVFWTSSDLPDMGQGLMNYQPNAAIDRWVKEKVLLPAKATECAAPKEAVSAMGMTRMIAYGDELNVAFPERPKDPKITWEPVWSAKVRLKSVATMMPGMGDMMGAAARAQQDKPPGDKVRGEDKPEPKKSLVPGAVNLLKGLFGQ